jgi:hypothetical protein
VREIDDLTEPKRKSEPDIAAQTATVSDEDAELVTLRPEYESKEWARFDDRRRLKEDISV